jgi:hypothetical protein
MKLINAPQDRSLGVAAACSQSRTAGHRDEPHRQGAGEGEREGKRHAPRVSWSTEEVMVRRDEAAPATTGRARSATPWPRTAAVGASRDRWGRSAAARGKGAWRRRRRVATAAPRSPRAVARPCRGRDRAKTRERERGVEEKLPEGGIRTRSWDSNEKLEKVERSRGDSGKGKDN